MPYAWAPFWSQSEAHFSADDYSGTIVQIGSEIAKSGFKGLKLEAGQDVFGTTLTQLKKGTMASYLLSSESDPIAVCTKPASLTFEEAASLGVVWLTGYTAFDKYAQLTKGGGSALKVAVM